MLPPDVSSPLALSHPSKEQVASHLHITCAAADVANSLRILPMAPYFADTTFLASAEALPPSQARGPDEIKSQNVCKMPDQHVQSDLPYCNDYDPEIAKGRTEDTENNSSTYSQAEDYHHDKRYR